MNDEDRHADEVSIAFQMGADWQRDRMKARIEKLEAILRELREMHYEGGIDDLKKRDDMTYAVICYALEGKDE